MNCKELRSCFENLPLAEAEPHSDSAEVAQHLATCAECRRLVEGQAGLARSLRMAREAAPRVSAALDAAVVASYRRHAAESSRPAQRQARLTFRRLGWSAAPAAVVFAGALLAGAFLFFTRGKPAITTQQHKAQPTTVTPVARTSPAVAVVVPPVEQKVDQKVERTQPRAVSPGIRRKAPDVARASQVDPMPSGFSSLMYCDELSCAGTMEVIRVQMPKSMLALGGPSAQASDTVVADVLVGADGIARGIRIEE